MKDSAKSTDPKLTFGRVMLEIGYTNLPIQV